MQVSSSSLPSRSAGRLGRGIGVLALLFALVAGSAAQTAAPAPVATGGPRIGYINMEKVFADYYKTKLADQQLRGQRDLARKFVADKQQQIKDMQKKLADLVDRGDEVLLTPAALAERREQVVALKEDLDYRMQELDSFTNDKMGQLVERFEQEREAILAEVTEKIKVFAEGRHLDLVLDLSGKNASQLSTVFFYASGTNLTEAVLADLNAGHEPHPAAAEPATSTAPVVPPPAKKSAP